MVINLEANDFNRQTRFLRNDNNILMTMGAGTYSVLAAMETAHLKRSHVLVGNFSSLANRIRFIIGQNHITTDSGWISTYPFDQFDVKVRDGIEQHNFAANHYQVVIGSDVWIGMDVQIMAGVHIGDGAIIGADAVIAKDVPPYAVVVGNPARIIKYRFDKETIDKLLKIRWWLWDNETLEARRQYMKDTKTFIEKFYEKPKKYEETQLIQLLKQEKKGGKFIYAALSDASDPTHTIVEIVQSYKSAFPQNTPVLLVIVTENDAVYQNLEEQLKTFDCPCPIYLASRAELEGVIANSNVIFTNRLDISSRAVEFATQYNIEIRSALDYDVFNKEKFLLKA